MPNSDPCQIITPLVLVGLGLGVGEGLGLGNHKAISTRGVIIWQGVENGHNMGYSVFLAIATNIPQRFKTGFVVQGHIFNAVTNNMLH